MAGSSAEFVPPDEAQPTGVMDPSDWMARGRRTVEGYLHVMRGTRKRRYGLFGDYIADVMEEAGEWRLPRWPDTHAVYQGFDESKPAGHQYVRPFLRYKASRPIEGLDRSHQGHRVRLTCSIGEPWSNGIGAYITRAVGECLTCAPIDRKEVEG